MLIMNISGKPFPMMNFLTDDFGNEVQTVFTLFGPSSRELVKVPFDTYSHLFDMQQAIRAEAEACAD